MKSPLSMTVNQAPLPYTPLERTVLHFILCFLVEKLLGTARMFLGIEVLV